jgi:uncharacterized protein YbgA (DUF1722 family)/uncharacterized protein YbbK (DUF523 family)
MTDLPQDSDSPIRVATSSCLLGAEVRFDGGHKHNGYITKTLARYFEMIPFCPEVAIGLGVPRPPIRLMSDGGQVRVVGVSDPDLDVTEDLMEYGRTVAAQLSDASGYIFKRGSPSCGMERVKIYSDKGMPVDSGAGIYAQTIMHELPLLPVEEEGRLMDPVLRENFIERVFVYHRLQSLCRSQLTPAKLIEFHTNHKFSVLAHDEAAYRELGQIVAAAGSADLPQLAERYATLLMTAMKKRATRKLHSNVLTHIMGFLKDHIDSGDKAELLEVIDKYRHEQIPLIVPVTLLKHHLRRYPDPYIARQYYLNPHPEELMLRNSL